MSYVDARSADDASDDFEVVREANDRLQRLVRRAERLLARSVHNPLSDMKPEHYDAERGAWFHDAKWGSSGEEGTP